MTPKRSADLEDAWSQHDSKWRDCAQVASQWSGASEVNARLLKLQSDRAFFKLLTKLGVTLVVSREYEHLVVALSAVRAEPRTTFFPLPHPSGVAVDRTRCEVNVASTRNPNQLFTFRPVEHALARKDARLGDMRGRPLLPVRSTFYPGCLYLHDLAFIGSRLYANSVGQNAVVRLGPDGTHERVWWPKSIETKTGARFGCNYLQLNSIAAGPSLRGSYFSASGEKPGQFRPGQLEYPVDGRGVIFSGKTREPICEGLTRPHSARLHGGALWVANSGYGEVVRIRGAKLETIARLPGWTRGLCFVNNVLFVGTSRVILRYARYAPGLKVNESICGVHAIDATNGKRLGSISWPFGNQIFAIDWLPAKCTLGFPFALPRDTEREKLLFYTFQHVNSRETQR